MKPMLFKNLSHLKMGALCLCLLLGTGCKKIAQHFIPNDYDQVNLVADVPGFGAAHIDSGLVNAWGIAVAPSGPIWISAAETGLSPIYDKTGATLRPSVAIPTPTDSVAEPLPVLYLTIPPILLFGKISRPSQAASSLPRKMVPLLPGVAEIPLPLS